MSIVQHDSSGNSIDLSSRIEIVQVRAGVITILYYCFVIYCLPRGNQDRNNNSL